MKMPRSKKKVISLVGARPQFIKLAALAPVISKRFTHIIVHSGQHYDRTMSDVFFRQLKIPKADFNLAVGSGNHGEMTGRIMSRFEKLLVKHQPDMVLVYGDTNSTLAGALTASKLHIPVAHVEAGLRSYRMDMPEEINRRLTDHISTLLFCPTSRAVSNLKSEGIKKGIVRSGDLMYELIDNTRQEIIQNRSILKKLKLEKKKYILLTMHRGGNVDCEDNMHKVADILSGMDRRIVFPVHPRTRKNLRHFGLLSKVKKLPNVDLIEPVPYLDNLSLMHYAGAVITDSGGIQKEAVALGTPCFTLRDETEWTETLKWGNHLVGLSARKISDGMRTLKKPVKKVNWKIQGRRPSEIMTASLLKFFKE